MSTTTEPDVLSRIADRVEVLDHQTGRIDDHVVAATGPELQPALSRAIYSRLYLGLAEDITDPDDRRLPSTREDNGYVAALSEAEGGRLVWQKGWTVVARDGDWTDVRSATDGVRLRAAAAEVRPAEPEPGDDVLIAFPTARRFVSPGFFLTHGVAGAEDPGRPVLRWYLNAPPEVGPTVFGDIVRVLDAELVPFTLKTVNDPAGPPRPDAMVLYTPRDADLGPHVQEVLAGVRLRDRVPAFTRRLSDGVGIADELEGRARRLSFGLHRSSLVARGVIAAGRGADLTTRRQAVDAAFQEAGLDPTRPHLGRGAVELDLSGWSS